MSKEQRYCTYDAGDVAEVLLHFEQRFGMSTAEFMDAYKTDGARVAAVPYWEQTVWSGMHAESKLLKPQGAFASHMDTSLSAA